MWQRTASGAAAAKQWSSAAVNVASVRPLRPPQEETLGVEQPKQCELLRTRWLKLLDLIGDLQIPAAAPANFRYGLLTITARRRQVTGEHQLMAIQLFETAHGGDDAADLGARARNIADLLHERLSPLSCDHDRLCGRR